MYRRKVTVTVSRWCFCELSCGFIMSLEVSVFFVDKTSLELVYLKQKRISKKKSCLLKKNNFM